MDFYSWKLPDQIEVICVAPQKLPETGFWPVPPPVSTLNRCSFQPSCPVEPPKNFESQNSPESSENSEEDEISSEENESIDTSSQSSGDDEESSYLSDESEFEETTSTSLQSIESYPIRSSDVYSADIIIHLKSTERKFMPKWNYMTQQPDLTFSMRSILVDWLVEVTEEFKLDNETLFLAVNYVDRFLSKMSVQQARIQLLGTACIFIASKFEESYPPDVTEFCYITDNTCLKDEVICMEHLILEALDFECSPSTTFNFVTHFSRFSGVLETSDERYLAQFLVELALMEAELFMQFPPSIIAASAVALAAHTLGVIAWGDSMVAKTGYTIEDFKDCLICLHELHSRAKKLPQKAIRHKYKNQKFNMVSDIVPMPLR